MTHTVADIHIDGGRERKKSQPHSKLNHNVFDANGRKQGSSFETLVFPLPVAVAFWRGDITIP